MLKNQLIVHVPTWSEDAYRYHYFFRLEHNCRRCAFNAIARIASGNGIEMLVSKNYYDYIRLHFNLLKIWEQKDSSNLLWEKTTV